MEIETRSITIADLMDEIIKLQEKVESLETHIKYMPNGIEYFNCKKKWKNRLRNLKGPILNKNEQSNENSP